MDSVPYSEVRAHLAETLKWLEFRDEPIYITRRGEPAAVLMSVSQYRRLQGEPADFASAYRAWRKEFERDLAESGDEEGVDPFASIRDPSPDGGRPPFEWPQDLMEDEAPAPATVSVGTVTGTSTSTSTSTSTHIGKA